ncbi:MAG: PIN domain-containing protein [Planctomycetes bacterium]|nr:PIN domain-containing protein [Planctomycetota bacterium]
MTLTDAGPLIALASRRDADHARCVEAARSLPSGPLVSTWPCFTEAMHVLLRVGGHPAQAALWTLLVAGRLQLHDFSTNEVDRMAGLMEKYRDRPMDLGDASIVVVADTLGTKLVFTLDQDFQIYRLDDGSALKIVP